MGKMKLKKDKEKKAKAKKQKEQKQAQQQGHPNIADYIIACQVPNMPTQKAIDDIRFDFNDGVRIRTSDVASNKKWRLQVFDEKTGFTLYDDIVGTNIIYRYPKRFYNEFSFKIYRCDENGVAEETPSFEHHFDLNDKNVLMFISVKDTFTTGLGDIVAWCAAIVEFQKKHNCHIDIVVQERFDVTPIIHDRYPELNFMSFDDFTKDYNKYYASYFPLVYLKDKDYGNAPLHFKYIGLENYSRYLLGLENEVIYENHLDLHTTDEPIIKEKYVCIASKSTGLLKTWVNPRGWPETIKFLKDNGYRVLCTDKYPEENYGGILMPFPEGAENFCDYGMKNIINLFTYCDFFIGLPSGQSWLARACGAPVVLISGFSNPFSEFFTPYRVQNFDVCNSCWNDMSLPWPKSFRRYCPHQENTPNEYICTRAISSKMVIDTIKRIPIFQKNQNV